MWKWSEPVTQETTLPEHLPLPRHHGKSCSDHPATVACLEQLPKGLWTKGPYDVGRLKTEPIKVEFLDPDQPPVWRPQYKLKPEQIEGITPTIEGLLHTGVIYPTKSSYNTPILPVSKGVGKGWRMVQDFRPINDITKPAAYPVPDPHVSLNNLTLHHTHFTVIDLANAFFSLPLHKSAQELFAFTFDGQQYTYASLPQGYRCSPGLFNHHLRIHLSELDLPKGVVLIQYVDDLLLAATSAALCLDSSVKLLSLLAEKGYKVKRSKVQFERREVVFLGRSVSSTGLGVSSTHRESILHHPQPQTVTQLLSFLGLTGYSRSHIPNYADLTTTVRTVLKEVSPRNLTAPLTWTGDALAAFATLKQTLSHATSLMAPDYAIPFHLDISENNSILNAV